MKSKLQKILGSSKEIFLITTSIFFFFLIILVFVLTLNKIEQRRYIGQEFKQKSAITVSGRGEILTVADLAIVNFSVNSEKKTVKEAMAENIEKMNNIINFMKEQGIEERDLRTVAFRVNPRYEWYDDEGQNRWGRGTRVLVGYEVRQSLKIKIRETNKIGIIIQGGIDFGADQVGSLQFVVDNREDFEKQAREKAIIEAKEEAKILSNQLGVELVRIVSFKEAGYYKQPQFRKGLRFEDIEAPMINAPIPVIEVGEDKIQTIIHITYEIR